MWIMVINQPILLPRNLELSPSTAALCTKHLLASDIICINYSQESPHLPLFVLHVQSYAE